MKPVIEVQDLYRNFSSTVSLKRSSSEKVRALRGISFNVSKGEIYGLLGPNGAGKTTTLKILSTMLAPTKGTAKIFGYNTFGEEKLIRQRINFIFGGERGFYWRLNTYEILSFFSDLYKIPQKVQKRRIPELLELVELSDKAARRKTETYSKGMKQRVQIARGLVNDPEVIFFDEPTLGLDPVSAKKFRKIVKRLASEGKTIILTTHYMSEAEDLCDNIGIINDGVMLKNDSMANIIQSIAKNESILEVSLKHLSPVKKAELLNSDKKNAISIKEIGENHIDINMKFNDQAEAKKVALSFFSDLPVFNMNIQKPTLEQAYLNIVESGENKTLSSARSEL